MGTGHEHGLTGFHQMAGRGHGGARATAPQAMAVSVLSILSQC